MEVAGRLVGQNEFRFGDDRARDADQLLLAAGELARVKILFPDDREAIEGIGDERGAFRFAVAPIGERDVEVLVNRQVIEQIVVLENETDLLVAQGGALFWLEAMDGGFVEEIFAGPAEDRACLTNAGGSICPAPDGPMTETKSPSSTSRLMSRRT